MLRVVLFILLYLINFFILVSFFNLFMGIDSFDFYRLSLFRKLLFAFVAGGSFWTDFWLFMMGPFYWPFWGGTFFYGLFWFLLSLLSLLSLGAFLLSLLLAVCLGSYFVKLFSGCLAPFFWSFPGGLAYTLGCYFLLSFPSFTSFFTSFAFLGSYLTGAFYFSTDLLLLFLFFGSFLASLLSLGGSYLTVGFLSPFFYASIKI